MKLQFSTATLLLAVTFIAVACGGIFLDRDFYERDIFFDPLFETWPAYLGTAPLWLPVAFAAYAAGRRSLSVWLVGLFTISEVTVCLVLYLRARAF